MKELPDIPHRKRRVSGPASLRKSSIDPNLVPVLAEKYEDDIGEDDDQGAINESRDHLESSLFQTRQSCGNKRISCREDSVESTTTSGGKSSVHYSDTSSLLSHRFSTISISSNVSSEVSSSCYLASMSSADFDDRPVIASSISLDEGDEAAEFGLLHHPLLPLHQQHPPQRTHHERIRRLKSLFRRTNQNSSSDLVNYIKKQRRRVA